MTPDPTAPPPTPQAPHRAPEPRLGGLPLSRYAGVQVGLSEGFPLEQVLVNEGVDARTYEQAAPAWAERLAEVEEGDEEGLLAAYEEHLARARERYGRRALPLAEDLRAWLAFLHRWSADPDPPALLAQVGLRLQDLARLQQAWGRRLAAQPELLREAAGAGEASPGPLPELVVEGPRLAPPAPLDEAAMRDIAPVRDDEDEGDEEDEEEERAESDAPRLFVPFESVEGEPREERAAAAEQASEEEEDETVQTRPWAIAPRPAPAMVTETQVAPLVAHAQPLPFREDGPEAVVQRLAAAGPPDLVLWRARSSGEDPVGSTTAAPLMSARPALPFAAPAGAAEVAPEIPPEPPESEPDPTVVTAPAPLAPRGPALPFQPAPPPRLSLEQYASLCAELAVYRGQEEEIFRLYGLVAVEARRAVDAEWKARLGQEPALYAAWQDLYRRHLALAVARRGVLG